MCPWKVYTKWQETVDLTNKSLLFILSVINAKRCLWNVGSDISPYLCSHWLIVYFPCVNYVAKCSCKAVYVNKTYNYVI